jgi:hypothetical protein
MLRVFVPVTPEQPVLVAVTVFEPAADQAIVTWLPFEAPEIVPPPAFQVQPVETAVQFVALAVNVSAASTAPELGPLIEMDFVGGGGVTPETVIIPCGTVTVSTPRTTCAVGVYCPAAA